MDTTSGTGYESPFQQPLFNLTAPTASADFSGILTIIFFLIFLVWIIHTAVIAYHWFRYSGKSWLAVPAVGLHLFITGSLIFYIATGVH